MGSSLPSIDGIKLSLLPAAILLCFSSGLFAQDTADYYNPAFLRHQNFIYSPTVKTVILERNNEPLTDAVIVLNSGQQLHLRFDDLNTEVKNYYYRFIHCDFNWLPSSLHESDYIDGFFYEQVQQYYPSFNTYQVYYHYSTVFPSDQMRITKSGNYILVVYDNENPEQAVITWRFRVIEQLVNIESDIHRATAIEERNSHQEIDFKINYSGQEIQNAFSEVKISLQQNGRWDNEITDLKPLFMKEDELDYNYETGNVFNGGNEFRNFDLRTLLSTTPFVRSIVSDPETGAYSVRLQNDASRSFERYSILDDINGKYLVKIYDGRNDNTEADYAAVQFNLKYSEPLANGTFYVMGALTNWTLLPHAKMVYNYNENAYQCSFPVKQGYYNYHYVWVEDGKSRADETIIEGNHFETENDYTLFVYYRQPAGRYDRIIGYKKLSSRNIY